MGRLEPEELYFRCRTEELARDVEDSRSLDALHLRPAARVLAHLHLKRSRHIIEIGAVEEGVWQSVDQPERHLVSRSSSARRTA